jgi:hypothetical protein
MDQFFLNQELVSVSNSSPEGLMDADSITLEAQEAINLSLDSFRGIFNPNWVTKYSELKSQLKTGDIILVHGKYPFSWVVELLQWSKWGHAAMVVRASDIDPPGQYNFPELMLWEANTGDQNVKNLWGANNEIKEGPMLIDLEARLKNTATYPDVEIVHRPLHLDLHNQEINFESLKPHMDSLIDKEFPSDKEIIYSVFLGRRYNRSSNKPEIGLNLIRRKSLSNPSMDTVELVNADTNYLKGLSMMDINKSKIYCSELIALAYKHLGLLTNFHVSNAYSPKDFCNEGSVRLLKRAWLGNEMYIDMAN